MNYWGSIPLFKLGGPYMAPTIGTHDIFTFDSGANIAAPLSFAIGTGAASTQLGTAQYAAPLIFTGSTVKTNLTLRSMNLPFMQLTSITCFGVPSGCYFSYRQFDGTNLINPVIVPELSKGFILGGLENDLGSLTLSPSGNPYAVTGGSWALCVERAVITLQQWTNNSSAVTGPIYPFARLSFQSTAAL